MKHPTPVIALLLAFSAAPVCAQQIHESDFSTNAHPRIFVTDADRPMLQAKIRTVSWAGALYEDIKREVDPIMKIHEQNPGYVISRMQMHWEPGKHYTHFYTQGNYIPRRSGNAKYPTVRLTYGRAASHSVPLAPLDKIIPYGDGSLTIPAGTKTSIYKITEHGDDMLSRLGSTVKYDTVAFDHTGLGTEVVNRAFIQLAWKASVLYYFTYDKRYARLAADILWTFVRGAAQQLPVNPDEQGGSNGYLSYETLGDTRHFATLPLAYDMIYHYLHDEYFDTKQFRQGIPGEPWAPPHPEGKQWALNQFEIMFKRLIDNKLQRGGGLIGNWNLNEQQSAMLYALALDADSTYKDCKGRDYYVNQLIYGPTTPTHGAYVDVLRANISPSTGLWPEAPGGYGQGSMSQLIKFGYIYYRNGIDLLSRDPLLRKMSAAMPQMLFPNGYVTNFGDATYSKINTDQLELMIAYCHAKGDRAGEQHFADLMGFAGSRDFRNEFYLPLFFYLPEIPKPDRAPRLDRTSYSKVYSLIFERNNAADHRDALAFTLDGYGRNMGHRQPNGMNMELYGRGHVLAPDQGIGQDYWSKDTHEYKINVAGHNTVSPNGCGADNDLPQELEIRHAEPAVIDGGKPDFEVSPFHQYVEAFNHFTTKEINADQQRLLSIIRTSAKTGYFVDIFRSRTIGGEDRYHDYIYHNMGTSSAMLDADGKAMTMTDEPLDPTSGKGYSFFETLGSKRTTGNFSVDFNLGVDSTHMRMFMLGEKGRTVYQLHSLFNHRYYIPALRRLPVPAVIVRNDGEAWNRPFIAVFEPYGNGAERQIEQIEREQTADQPGVDKLTVRLTDGVRKDRILHCTDSTVTAHYADIRFRGTFAVVSYSGRNISAIYLGNATSFRAKGIRISGEAPFDGWFVLDHGVWKYRSRQQITVKDRRKAIPAGL